jgi:hypothetical protein
MPGAPVELPPAFADLAPFVADWGGLETQDQRYRRRQSLTIEQLRDYYNAVAPRLDAIFDHLDGFAFGSQLPPPEALLLQVAMGLTEAAQAVENYGRPGVPHAPADHSVPIIGLSCG